MEKIISDTSIDNGLDRECILDKIKSVESFLELPPISVKDLHYESEEPTGHFNSIYLQRIVTVSLCEQIWIEQISNLKVVKKSGVYEDVIQYLVYKTLSIVSKYPNYGDISKKIFTVIDFITAEGIADLKVAINDVVNKILEDVNGNKTHITLKIRQCLNFIQNHPYGDAVYEKNEVKFVDISTFHTKVINIGEDSKKSPYDYFFPAIFRVDVLLEQEDNKWGENTSQDGLFVLYNKEDQKSTLLSELSSGERQQINSVSSIIYHLRNIDSVANDETKLVKYKYVNLIFEEIELYFHPEFQRTFLDFLLKHISGVKLKLESINLCFVTHSPFILSDIPQQNILVLKEGHPNLITFNTLGANIHEILASNFMLEYTMGEVVRSKVQKFLERYSEFKNNNTTDVVNFLTQHEIKFLIYNMGDGYLKSMLNGYYEEMMESTQDGLKKLIETKELELQKLKDKNNHCKEI